ncbi:hypothetical protein N8681_00460 [bacterium]|nr:hypothetical protein [bacterium]
MFPYERSLVENWKNEPFALVGVNTDPPERLSKYVKNGTITWRNFRDGKAGGADFKQMGHRGLANHLRIGS